MLISGSVITDKYKMATKIGIPVVSEKWINDSFLKGEFLPTNGYKLPFLTGATLGVLGFPENQLQEIKVLIDREGGNYYCAHAELKANKGLITLIIVRKTHYKVHEQFLRKEKFRNIVSPEWLADCSDHEMFIPPKAKYWLRTVPK